VRAELRYYYCGTDFTLSKGRNEYGGFVYQYESPRIFAMFYRLHRALGYLGDIKDANEQLKFAAFIMQRKT
jgi:hypothetical protein